MLRLALKRSSQLATLRSLAAVETLLHHHSSPPAAFRGDAAFLVKDCCAPRQFFHSKPERLDFEATLAPRIESAVEHSWYDDEKVSPLASKGNGDDGLDIAKLGISEEIVSALASRGITKLFPIQRAVLEPAMKGRDMYGRARTGTGKTLAFGIPILDKIVKFNQKHGRGKYPLALVLAPTRELARQVEKEFRESAPNLDTICVYGGTPINRQMRELDYGVDIAVGTPGRIIDLMKRGALNLSEVQFVVIDEADQMLGVGFVDDVETIFQRLPKNRQSMLFSATMPSWIRNLIRKYLKDPLTIDLVGDSDQKLADGISLFSIAADMYGKASILVPLIKEHANGGKCIIFTQTKRDADRLANAMARSLRCEALHGDISQFGRERTLSGFRNGDFNILVATDVAARGLDIPNVDLIIHYEIPNCAETFVHRSGRTGRAGKKGTAILIYTEDQTRQVRIFEREVGCRFTQLPRIAAEDANQDMLNCMDNGGRYSSFGGMRDRVKRFARSGSFGDYGSGQGGQFSGQTNGYGRSGYNRNQGGKFGGFEGASGRSGSFGDFGSDRPSQFGDNSRRNSAFGDLGSNRPSRFGDNSGQNSAFGDFGLDRPARFGNNFSNQNKSVPSDSQFSFGRRQS